MSIFTKSRRRLAAVAAITVFTALAGTAAWGYWTTQATAGVTANSADLTVATANFATVSKTFSNSSLVGTGSVTVTNSTAGSSAQQGKVTLTFSATGADGYRSNFSYVVWRSTASNPCTDAATAGTTLASGSWSGTSSYTTPDGSGFTVGESRTYCVRTTVSSATTNWPSSGTVTFTPQVAASIVLGNYSGSASATATQQIEYVFPVVTPTTGGTAWFYIHRTFSSSSADNYCMDLEGGGGPNAIAWTCKTSGTTNQAFGFYAVSGKAGYYTIRSNITAATVLQQNATGTPVTAVAAVTGQLNQQWTIQQTAASFTSGGVTRALYQFVNASTGQCLTRTTSGSGQMQMAACDGTSSQQFLMVRTMFSGVNGANATVTCAYDQGTSNGTSTFDITLSAATPGMRYELRVGGTFAVAATASAGGTATLSRTYSQASSANYEIWEDSGATADPGTLVASGTLTKGALYWYGNSCTASGLG